MTARTPPPLSESDRPDVLQSLRDGWSLDDAARGFRRKGADVLADADANGWRSDLDAAIAEGRRQAAPRDMAAEWKKAILVNQATQSLPEAPAADEPTVADSDDAPSLDRVTTEAARLAPGPFGFFLWVDARCVAFGMPPASPWWRFSIGEFYASGKPWGIFLVGRGGGKSTTLEKVAGTDSLYIPRRIYPGQTWTWPFISVGPDDANRRLNGIAAVYRAIGLPFVGEDDGEGKKLKEGVKLNRAPRFSLELEDARGNPIQLASVAGTIGNVSGPSTIGMTIDEAAKLLDKATGANPLTEIVISVAQTSRARAGWRAICCSSAWEKTGAHWQLVEQGDNETNYVARIGEAFLADALRGFELVAQWEERGGENRAPNPSAAEAIRKHAATLTARSPLVPTWLANPTLGHPEEKPWDGAAVASRKLVQVLPEKALEGLPRWLYWLRENGSLPLEASGIGALDTLRDITPAHVAAPRWLDLVTGAAPSIDGSAWGIVVVAYAIDGVLVVVSDGSGHVTSGQAIHNLILAPASILAVARAHAPRLASEIAAARAEQYAPPVAEQDVYDGAVLRVGPLRSLYLAGRLRHAPGLDALEAEARAWTPGGKRSPRLEALAVAVKRLVDCYPWAAGRDDAAIRGPTPEGSPLDRNGDARGTLERLGARPGRDGVI